MCRSKIIRKDSCQEVHTTEIPDQQLRDHQHELLTAESAKTRDYFIIVLSLPIQFLILSWLASIKVRATIILLRYKANNASLPGLTHCTCTYGDDGLHG